MSRRRKNNRFLWLLLLLMLMGTMAFGVYWGIRSGVITKSLQPVDDTKYDREITAAAARHGLPKALVRAVIRRESRFQADAAGRKGEIGLMQVLPSGAAAEWSRVHKKRCPSKRELFNVETNLDIGCWYLARALKRWKDYRCAIELALAEYNAGLSNAKRWKPADRNGDVVSRITFPATKEYVTTIMRYYRKELDGKTLR